MKLANACSRPIVTLVSKSEELLGTTTAIARRFPKGQAKHCNLCDDCSAKNDTCLLIFKMNIQEDEVAEFGNRRLAELERIRDGALGREAALA